MSTNPASVAVIVQACAEHAEPMRLAIAKHALGKPSTLDNHTRHPVCDREVCAAKASVLIHAALPCMSPRDADMRATAIGRRVTASEAVELAVLRARYRAAKWSRYIVVNRVHADPPRCGVLRVGTRYGYAPQFSGSTVAEVIAASGEQACSRCFPDAPVAPRAKPVADPNRCSGSGTSYAPGTGTARGMRRYGTCGVCSREDVPINRNSTALRAHRAL